MRIAILAAAVMILALHANAAPSAADKDAFFRTIDALIARRVLRPGSTAKTLGLKPRFVKTPEADASWSTFEARGAAGAAVTRLELRTTEEPGDDAFVIIDVSKELGIGIQDVQKHFGEDASSYHNPAPPPGGWPARYEDPGFSLIYLKAGREVRFGMSGEKIPRLQAVVLDKNHILDWGARETKKVSK
jgi:hypothetical protein